MSAIEIRDVLVDLLQWLDGLPTFQTSPDGMHLLDRATIRGHVVELFEASRAAERSTEVAADAEFPFEEGDRIRGNRNWKPGNWAEVLYVGVHYWFGREADGTEERYIINGGSGFRWERYHEPSSYPERWFAVFATSVDTARVVEYAARDDLLAHRNIERLRLGILHLRADGTTEMLAP